MKNVSTRRLSLAVGALLGAACGASPDGQEPSPSQAGMFNETDGVGETPSGIPASPGDVATGGSASEGSPAPANTPLLPDTVPGEGTPTPEALAGLREANASLQ